MFLHNLYIYDKMTSEKYLFIILANNEFSGGTMKFLSMILWVSQFGFSVLFPLCLFLYVGFWLQNRFDLGIWVMIVCGVIGFMTSIQTAKSCLHSLLKARDEAASQEKPPVSFNDHN